MTIQVRRVLVAAIVALGALRPAAAPAQSVSGSVAGTVVDQTRQLVPGATVTLVNEQTADARVTSSNETGAFVFSAVQPGTYTVRVELPGFATFELQHTVVPANEQVPVGALQLNVGALTETVTATSIGSIVQTLSSERSALITSTQIEQVADRGRDVVSLLRILPGVAYQTLTDSPGGNFGSTTPNINGTRATWNTMTVDGVVGNDLGSPQLFSSSINFDAIGEVQVELNNYRAEYGRNGGPVVNIVTKSGTRDYKGSAYWYKRNEGLNANDFFNNRNGIAKPVYRFDTVGGTVGGPAPLPKGGKDKLFFFYSFDGLKSLNPRPLQQVTTPSALERAGDFSQSLDTNGRLIVVRDPLTGLLSGAGQQRADRKGSGHRGDRPGCADRRARARHRRSERRHRAGDRCLVPGRLQGSGSAAARASGWICLRPPRRRQDGRARQRRDVSQHPPVGQRELAGHPQSAAAAEPADLLWIDGHAAAVDRLQLSERRAGVRERNADADALQLLDRRPAGHRLGHDGRRRIRRIAIAQPAADAQPEYRAVRRALPPGEPGSDARERAAARQLLPTDPRLRQRLAVRELRQGGLQRAATAGEPPVQEGAAIRRRLYAVAVARLHVEQRDRHRREHADRHLPESRHLELGLSSYDQTHVAVINYTWELPRARWSNAFARARLDNWQFSGLTTLASGTPVNVTFAASDGADITGGGDLARATGVAAGSLVPNLIGDPNLPSSQRSLRQWFNTAAFARPAKGDPGNSPKDVIRGPGVTNSDVTLFKNIPFGAAGRKLQLRWEIYNVFNQVQFATVDATARFDAAGNQLNTRFGQVITTRAPRVMQIALRLVV